jgi:hypothetical protein
VVASNLNAVTLLNNAAPVVNFPTVGTVYVHSVTQNMVFNNRDRSQPFIASNAEINWSPTRSTADYSYLFKIDDGGGSTSGQMTGGAAQKTYALGILVNRPTGAVATGDSNDAIIRGSYNNYALNDANFLVRGINTIVSNRSPGTLGMIDNLLSVANRSGATSPITRGLYVGVENYGTVANQFGGIWVDLRNEAAVATLEYGVKVINTNNSLATAVDSAFLVADTGANVGFNVGLNLAGSTIQQADVRLSGLAEILSGAGVPGGGLCTAANLGAIYLNHGGGGGTSLYVCEVAGAWAAK